MVQRLREKKSGAAKGRGQAEAPLSTLTKTVHEGPNLSQVQLRAVYARVPDSFNCVAFSPDGEYIATASDDTNVRVWESSSGRLVRTLEGHSGGVLSVAWGTEGGGDARGSGDSTVRVGEASGGG